MRLRAQYGDAAVRRRLARMRGPAGPGENPNLTPIGGGGGDNANLTPIGVQVCWLALGPVPVAQERRCLSDGKRAAVNLLCKRALQCTADLFKFQFSIPPKVTKEDELRARRCQTPGVSPLLSNLSRQTCSLLTITCHTPGD